MNSVLNVVMTTNIMFSFLFVYVYRLCCKVVIWKKGTLILNVCFLKSYVLCLANGPAFFSSCSPLFLFLFFFLLCILLCILISLKFPIHFPSPTIIDGSSFFLHCGFFKLQFWVFSKLPDAFHSLELYDLNRVGNILVKFCVLKISFS